MPRLEFSPVIEGIKEDAIEAAKAAEPDFTGAREGLNAALDMTRGQYGELATTIYVGRINNDLGVVDVREGLYHRSHLDASDDFALDMAQGGLGLIRSSYNILRTTRNNRWPEVADMG